MKSALLLATAVALAAAAPAFAQDAHQGHAPQAPHADPHAGHDAQAAPAEAAPQPADPHAGHAPQAAPDAAAADGPHAGHAAPGAGGGMTGLYGGYPAGRDASGTSWQPDATGHGGLHSQAGDWMLMGHADLYGVYSSQGGPRGDDKAFLAGMVMGAARRDFATGDMLNLRLMLSPDPFMGRSGYPLLLAAGETADGVNPLVDRQHPHDLFVEMSAAYTHRLSQADSIFLYAGLPGEPAFGPPSFMHRASGMDSPEAPITHHWLDSTHITFGVLTAGWVHDRFKLDASAFRGREPDEDRYDIEAPRLDSFAARLSWNPTPEWSLQASYANIESPEQLEPELDEERVSASAAYARTFEGGGRWAATASFARKMRSDGVELDAWLLETAVTPGALPLTMFARAESIETDELDSHGGHGHGEVFRVGKVSVGGVYDVPLSDTVSIGIGGLYSLNFVPEGLEHAYGERNPSGAMGFVRLTIGG